MHCQFIPCKTPSRFICLVCEIPSSRNKTYSDQGPPPRLCNASPPDMGPTIAFLAELTGQPEIIDQPKSYAQAAQRWAAGIPGELEPYECRDDSEVAFIQTLCRESGCGKLRGGVCKPSCGPGMIVAVKARMATEGCPWTCRAW